MSDFDDLSQISDELYDLEDEFGEADMPLLVDEAAQVAAGLKGFDIKLFHLKIRLAGFFWRIVENDPKTKERAMSILAGYFRYSPQSVRRLAALGDILTLAEREELLLPDIPLGMYWYCIKACTNDDGDLDVTAWVKAVKWIIKNDPTLPQLKAYFGEVKEPPEPGITIENVGIIQAFGEQQPILTMPADDRLPENATATVTVKVVPKLAAEMVEEAEK